MIKKLAPCLGQYKKYAILAPLTIICEVVLEIFIPFLMAKIIDVGIKAQNVSYVMKFGGLMIVMALLSLAFGALSARFAAIASTGFAKGVRKTLFDKVQDFSFANIDRFSTASLVTRLTTDVTNTQNAFMMLTRMAVRAPIMLICATVMAIRINVELAVVFFVAIPFLGIALYFIATQAYPRYRTMLKCYDQMNAQVQENLVGIRLVKAFVRGDYENEKFQKAADAVRDAQLKAEKFLVCNMPIMQFTMYLCIVCICWFGGNMIIGGTMQTGELMSFLSYVTQILMSLMMISMVFVNLVLSRASYFRIIEVLNEEIDVRDKEDSTEKIVKDGSVIFEDVSFSYGKEEDNLTLEHINLMIRSGEKVGIIGGTGSSKTTLVQLIPRLYDAFDGRVLVGGHDVREYTMETLRSEVAMVLQKNVLFSGTIKENLQFGNENTTEEEIIEACTAAQAHAFIMSFTDGYDTNLGQGGVNLSGGQKQRICIARALLKKPKIMILDDSTSAVDTATDSKIRAAFKEKLVHTTVIIIAQRITSVCDADQIIVMDDGKINAIGTHQQLLLSNAIYKEVYESQQKGVA